MKSTNTNFFDTFPNFTLDPTAPLSEEFARLALQRQWKKGGKTWKKHWNRFASCGYERYIGNTLSELQGWPRLEAWQRLCREVGIQKEVLSITKCKRALKRVYVNIIDLIDSRASGGTLKVRQFPNERALRDDMIENHRYFRKVNAKKDGFLKIFLRQIT